MTEALVLIQWLSAALAAGMNMAEVLGRVSALINERAAAGKTFSHQDLLDLFDAGDAVEAAARKQFADTLADPNTPKP